MKNFKVIGILMLFLVSIVAIGSSARADLNADILSVEVDGVELDSTSEINRLDLERGNDFEVKVIIEANENYNNTQIEVSLYGVHNERINDITSTFDMVGGISYVKRLSLELPDRMDQDNYQLKVRVEGREDSFSATYNLSINTARNDVVIKDTVFSPGEEVKQGRALLTTVRVKNMGEKDEEGVKVTFSIPSLGLSESDYIDELDAGDSTTSEELYVKIPNCAEVGSYAYEVEVKYDDGDETTTETGTLYVAEGDMCTAVEEAVPTTMVTVGPATQDVKQGASAIYPVTLTNSGAEAKSYTVSVDGVAEWAVATLDPAASVLLQPGESKAVYVYIAANDDASAGEHMFTLTISSGTETLKDVALKANVLEDGKSDFKRGLEIGLIVLVILLVILGLIVGFNKLRGDDESEDTGDDTETYY